MISLMPSLTRMVVMIMRMTQKILRKRKGNIVTMLLPLVLQWWRAGGGGSSGGGGGDGRDEKTQHYE